MIIRTAKLQDAEKLAAIAICVWIDTYAVNGAEEKVSRYAMTNFTATVFAKTINEKLVLVCESDNGLLGYTVIDKPQQNKVEIETLYVLPKFQGQGIGRSFIDKVVELYKYNIWLSVWIENQKALRFYKHLGFVEDGELFFDLYGEKIRNIVLKRENDF